MRKIFVFLHVILFVYKSFSQPDYPAFGKAEMTELLLKECSFEKGANAMKLFDFRETNIFTNGNTLRIETERRTRIKIFNEEGFKAANISIPYFQAKKRSKVTDISAYIYNLDSTGTTIITEKVDKELVFKESVKKGISMVSFTFPKVKPGCVIEFRYTHIDKNSFHIEPWLLQDEIPTALSICKLAYPSGMTIDHRIISVSDILKEPGKKSMRQIETFTQKNIPAFKEEFLMSSVKDNLQRIDFSYTPVVSFFNFKLGENKRDPLTRFLVKFTQFGEQIDLDIKEASQILDSAKVLPSDNDKIHFICQRVKALLQWDNTFSFYPDDLNEIWKNKAGNSAEINLSILNLLRKSGIKAHPLLISTRNNGKPDRSFNSLNQFNNVIVLIDDNSQPYFIDGTQKYISHKIPPDYILNRDVLMINTDSLTSNWLTISDARQLLRTTIIGQASLIGDTVLKGDANITYYDYSKANEIEQQNKKESQDDAKEFVEGDVPDVSIDSLVKENAENELMPLIHKVTFTYKPSSAGSYSYIDPFFLSGFRKNPFTSDERRTDIDMGSNQSFKVHLYINVPENFQIEELPKNIVIRSDDSSMIFSREILHQNKDLLFRCSFDVFRAVFTKEEYPAIKEFFKKMYALLSDKIVFKKE